CQKQDRGQRGRHGRSWVLVPLRQHPSRLSQPGYSKRDRWSHDLLLVVPVRNKGLIDASGVVAVHWDIAPRGEVTSTNVVPSDTTLTNKRVVACILKEVATWKFAAKGVPTNVAKFPFRFGASD